MAERKSFLLRIDTGILDAMQRWANDDLRSLNAQIEYQLREALRRAGRAAGESSPAPSSGDADGRPGGQHGQP